MDKKNPDTMNALVLAWIGDVRYAAFVRDRLVATTDLRVADLQVKANAYVSARAQAVYYDLLEPQFTESELATARRGRNAHNGHVAKNASIAEYKKSTALEAVIGWLHVRGEESRIDELMTQIMNYGGVK